MVPWDCSRSLHLPPTFQHYMHLRLLFYATLLANSRNLQWSLVSSVKCQSNRRNNLCILYHRQTRALPSELLSLYRLSYSFYLSRLLLNSAGPKTTWSERTVYFESTYASTLLCGNFSASLPCSNCTSRQKSLTFVLIPLKYQRVTSS